MININFKKISIDSSSDNSGVFVGKNFDPGWSVFSKSNTNVSGNKVKDTVNIIYDNDGCDLTVRNKENAEEVVITKDKSTTKKKNKKPNPKSKKVVVK